MYNFNLIFDHPILNFIMFYFPSRPSFPLLHLGIVDENLFWMYHEAKN